MYDGVSLSDGLQRATGEFSVTVKRRGAKFRYWGIASGRVFEGSVSAAAGAGLV